MEQGRSKGLRIFFNPAPFDERVLSYPLSLVDTFVVNEIEGQGLTGAKEPKAIIEKLSDRFSQSSILLTLGPDGVMHRSQREALSVPAVPVKVKDTTAAGDTFIGYYIACLAKGMPIKECLKTACKAASICVSRPGAADSIPKWEEVGMKNEKYGIME
jgi:ribokinase